jgi:hypothetical protein
VKFLFRNQPVTPSLRATSRGRIAELGDGLARPSAATGRIVYLNDICAFIEPGRGDKDHLPGLQRCERMRKCYEEITSRK